MPQTLQHIGILGAGAMGTLFGARLAHAGVRVTLVDVDDAVLAALRRDGARCLTDDGLLQAPVDAVHAAQLDAGNAPPLWLVFTKSAHTESALQGIAHAIGKHTWLLSLQNGIGHAPVLQRFAAPDRIALGITTWPARLLGPGHVHSPGSGGIRFMSADGQPHAFLDGIEQALNRAGLHSHVDDEVWAAIWEKLAFNAAFNGVCGITTQTVDGLDNPLGRELLDGVAGEVLAVARAEGVAASAERVRAAMHDALAHHRGHRPSMLQDLLAGRATEVAAIHGAALAAAERHGLATPMLRALHHLIRLREQAPLS